MKGTGCGAICSAQARARTRAGALQRARHRDGEVAAAGGLLGAWRVSGSSSAKAKSGRGGRARSVGGQREQEVASGRPSAAVGAAQRR
jgi:hypothetical protein